MIRNTTRDDIIYIESLMKSVLGFWDNSWRDDVIKQAITASNSLSYVWEQDDQILGFVCAHDLGFRGYLSELVVSEKVQGKGIGKQLVEKVENELKQRRCAILIADIWHDAVGFYTKLGWSAPDVELLRKKL